MTDPLSGALAKVARAEEHLGCLNDAIDWWRKQEGGTLTDHQNPEQTVYRFVLDLSVIPDITRWALLIGDCVHNLRSALDNAIYECSGPTPPAGCEFPIFLSRRYFDLPETDRRSHLYKIRGVESEVVRTLIERAQPWQDPNRAHNHPLWVVHQLDIQDKHRLLTPVASTPRYSDLNVRVEYRDAGQHASDLSGPLWIPFENHAEVLTLETLEPVKRVKMEVGFQLGIVVLVENTMHPIPSTLGKAVRYTRSLIEQIRDSVV